MYQRKRGHVTITTTLRPEEVTLLQSLVDRFEQARRKRLRHPETYLPTDRDKVTVTGVSRAALRYILEHEAEFEAWLKNGESR